MIWLVATALGGPPGVVMVGPEDTKALGKVQKTTLLPGLEPVEAKDVGLEAYLGIWGDLCSVQLSEEAVAELAVHQADRPELWVAKTGESGLGLWKWEPNLKVLQRHVDSEGVDDQPADIVVLEWEGAAATLPKKASSKLGHTDVAVRAGEGTSEITKVLMTQHQECIPSIGKDELTKINGFAQEGRALYIAVVPAKGAPLLWRWDIELNGLRRI